MASAAMDHELWQLERIVEREARMLDALPAGALGGDLLTRVRAAVRAEAARVRAARRRRAAWRWFGSAAAAALLIGGVRLVQPTPPAARSAADDPVRRLDEWVSAVEESQQLLDEAGFCYGPRGFDDEEKRLDELLESLERSLNIGA
jgi:hypothetical protein